MAFKLYLHATTTSQGGTLPASNASISATTPTQIVSGSNRQMNVTIGASQASLALTTNANTNAQPSLIGRWVTEPLVSNSGFSSGLWSLHFGASESNAASNFQITPVLAIYRPSTGQVVATISDIAVSSGEPGTSETAIQTPANFGSASGSWLDGDIIILELWRDNTTQSMGTAYTNTIFYDGTTEDSTSNNAAYLTNTATIKYLGQGYGQSQAQIIASKQVYGQAQADIKATSQKFAQAQAKISGAAATTTNAYAQAQANIKQTSRVYGQAQADIKAISRAYAQAQADTKQSYTVYAQGQAHINQSHTVYGQAQAFIYIPQISVPISDISNDSWVRVVV